jgi:hypothetical protein
MKKIIIFVVICVFISGCDISSSKQKTFSGILEVTEGTKGGDGYDSCLGSPFYKLKLPSGKEIKIDPYPLLAKDKGISLSDFEDLLGKHLKITGKYIKKQSVPNESNDDGAQKEFSSDTKSINCNHIELLVFEILD